MRTGVFDLARLLCLSQFLGQRQIVASSRPSLEVPDAIACDLLAGCGLLEAAVTETGRNTVAVLLG